MQTTRLFYGPMLIVPVRLENASPRDLAYARDDPMLGAIYTVPAELADRIDKSWNDLVDAMEKVRSFTAEPVPPS